MIGPLYEIEMIAKVIRPILENRGLQGRGFCAAHCGLGTILHATNPQAAQGALRHANAAVTRPFYVKKISDVTDAALRQLEANSARLRDRQGMVLQIPAKT
jgi:hypothetical protein